MAFNKTITVGEVEGLNEYGDLLFKDEDGNDYKIKSKRDKLFQAVQEGNKLELHIDTFRDHDYISGLTLLEGKAQEAEITKKPAGQASEHSGQETGMWWKELGEMLRSDDIDKTTPMGKALRSAYYAQMFSVLGIKMERKEK